MTFSESSAAPTDIVEQPHTSVLLQQLIDQAPKDVFTLAWLFGTLPKNSFGVILLFLALIALLPVISIPARLLILVLILQIIVGYRAPVLPEKLVKKRLPSSYLILLNRHAISALRLLERFVRPRWPLFLVIVRRPTAVIALILTILSLLAPLPFSNVPPAIVSILISLAYIEHDGLLLSIALFFACAMLGFVAFFI
jgi:hypothetical protein